jgi:mRNA interferase YafQ
MKNSDNNILSQRVIVYSSAFRKDIKNYKHNKRIQRILEDIVVKLSNREKLPEKHRDHPIIAGKLGKGGVKECRNCHLAPDIILLYQINNGNVELLRIGNHGKIFDY